MNNHLDHLAQGHTTNPQTQTTFLMSLCLEPLVRTVRSELLKKADGRSQLRRAGFISGNKRKVGQPREAGSPGGKWSQPREVGTCSVVLGSGFLNAKTCVRLRYYILIG